MLNFDQNKQTQLNQILNLAKIASLCIPAIAYMQYALKENNNDWSLKNGFLLIIVFTIILVVYLLWTFLQSRISNKSILKMWIDPMISLSISFISVMTTGTYQSSYKFLFIFVIIYSSIECSRRASMTIAGISALCIMSIDLIFPPIDTVNTFFQSDIVLASVFLFIAWVIGYYVSLEKSHIERLNNLANVDGLTGLYNHRYFYEIMEQRVSESKSEGKELSLLFIDIDNFKIYNDIYGHQKGDDILKTVAGLMQEVLVNRNFLARYGGEEFAAILPKCGESDAIALAEKLREVIQKYPFVGQESLPGASLTVSIGISTMPTRAKTMADLVKSADDACYRAKFLSKNRVEVYYSILEDIQKDVDESDREIVASIKTLIAVINAKDKYTYRHVERVVYYCNTFADYIHLDAKQKKNLVNAAYLHDIGKINIPEEILTKVEPLTQEEWELLRMHPQKAVEIVQNIAPLRDCAPIILQHHEMYNGTGYPNHLKGGEIDYLARVLTVADSFDAMTSFRPYQPKRSYGQALTELQKCSGTQFDPEIAKQFIQMVREKSVLTL